MLLSTKVEMVEKGVRWNRVRGPIAATIATCARIGWTVVNATKLLSHTGRVFDLEVDPPVVVREAANDAVKLWRWQRIEREPSLKSATAAAEAAMEGKLDPSGPH